MRSERFSGRRGWCRSSSAKLGRHAAVLDDAARVIEDRAVHHQQRRLRLLVEQARLVAVGGLGADALARQPDVHTPRAQRLIQPGLLEFGGVGGQRRRQVIGHQRQRLAPGAAQPAHHHHLAVGGQIQVLRDVVRCGSDLVIEDLRCRLLARASEGPHPSPPRLDILIESPLGRGDWRTSSGGRTLRHDPTPKAAAPSAQGSSELELSRVQLLALLKHALVPAAPKYIVRELLSQARQVMRQRQLADAGRFSPDSAAPGLAE